ncbi:hypothetical protein ACA910_003911 [Epithemia clementina (nom. ined.)]
MKVVAALIATAASASAFVPSTFGVRSPSSLCMSFDLDYGKKNAYVPASAGDGGQGTFGAVSPNNWRVPGTSPVGQTSYGGASDGGDEPWFAEAVSTVSLDLAKAEETLKAFTKEAAEFKMEAFASENSVGDKAKAMDDLISSMGYAAFLEASPKQLKKAWDGLKG